MKDLNKLAEELDPEVWAENHEDHWSDDWDILNAQIGKFAQAFHKHALKQLLDKWTDERINRWAYPYFPDRAIKFRDELKKEIGE